MQKTPSKYIFITILQNFSHSPLISNINNLTMSTEIFDTKLFDEKEQPAETFPETDSISQTSFSSAHEININTNQLQDVLIPLTSTPRTHGNNKDSNKDLHTVDIFEHKTLNLFQEFLSFLDEKTKMKQPHTSRNMTRTYGHDKIKYPKPNLTLIHSHHLPIRTFKTK